MSKRGFTLVELLVVVTIIGILAALIGPAVFKRLGQSKQHAARAQIEMLGAALDAFRLDVGRYPTTEEGLQALIEPPQGVESWKGPYLRKKKVPLDPWGNPYYYLCPGEHGDYDLCSLGRDGHPGGEDEDKDICNYD